MITAAGLADALTSAFLELVSPGAEREALAIELLEPASPATVERGDLVVLVGARAEDEVLAAIARCAPSAGLVLRRSWADLAHVRERCVQEGLPLLRVPDEVSWSSAVGLLRTALDKAATVGPLGGVGDQVHGDLFDMADKVSAIVGATVTIEDATSRVLAYSTGQHDVDDARTSTIVGRQVPRPVRAHFRSLGVFRRLATSDEPFFVPAGDEGVKPRYVVPVRVGGEWLGSVWAVVEAPPPSEQARELAAAAEVIALYLLRLRAHSELRRQVRRDQVRTLLRGSGDRTGDLGQGPWRVALLRGPGRALGAEERCELWLALARRHGWRQPMLTDLDGEVYAVLDASGTGTGAGSWAWLGEMVREEGKRDPTLGVAGGGCVETVAALVGSRALADELDRLGRDGVPAAVVSSETAWPEIVLARAVAGPGSAPLVSPVADLVAGTNASDSTLSTLEAVIDYWGEPQRAARALGVHANTVRYRMARLAETSSIDLGDPAQRLAIRLEIARVRART